MATQDSTRFVVFQEDDKFVAMCLEQYICAQGCNMDELYLRLRIAYRAERDESIAQTGEPFGDVPAAPQRYHDMWEENGDGVHRGRMYPLPDHTSNVLALAA